MLLLQFGLNSGWVVTSYTCCVSSRKIRKADVNITTNEVNMYELKGLNFPHFFVFVYDIIEQCVFVCSSGHFTKSMPPKKPQQVCPPPQKKRFCFSPRKKVFAQPHPPKKRFCPPPQKRFCLHPNENFTPQKSRLEPPKKTSFPPPRKIKSWVQN